MIKIKVDKLRVTQYGFRNRPQIQGMIDFVKEGGFFDEKSLKSPGPLMQIALFEDGKLYIADGHHRVVAIILGGRDYLDFSEFKITKWKYSDYTDINLNVGWVTPFDPRQELRIADYAEYKEALNHISDDKKEEFIRDNKEMYVEPKTIDLASEMIDEFDLP